MSDFEGLDTSNYEINGQKWDDYFKKPELEEGILHNELEEAQLAADLKWAEGQSKAAGDLSTADGVLDGVSALQGVEDANEQREDDQEEVLKMADYMHWSKDPYVETIEEQQTDMETVEEQSTAEALVEKQPETEPESESPSEVENQSEDLNDKEEDNEYSDWTY